MKERMTTSPHDLHILGYTCITKIIAKRRKNENLS